MEPDRIHTAWLLWEFLLDSSDFSALKNSFASCWTAAAYLIGAADARQAEVYEWHPKKPAWLAPHEDGLLAAANHFTAPDWVNTPLAESCGEASSVNRRCNLLRLAGGLLENGGKIGLPEMISIMSKTVAEGGAKVNGTLFQIIAAPAEQCWHIRLKNSADWTEIQLANLLKGNGDLA